MAIASSLCNFLVYYTRYPILMLPERAAEQTFAVLWGTEVSLQDALSLAFCTGFGLAKLPAVRVTSSEHFFRHRCSVLSTLVALAPACSTLPLALGLGPGAVVAGVFVGMMPTSWFYGMLVTYLEGRRATEMLLAWVSLSITFGGSASRGSAAAALAAGMPAHVMPLAVAGIVLLPALGLLRVLDRSPPPTRADEEQRRPRTAMTGAEQRALVRAYWPGVVLLVMGNALLQALRQFRDLFSRELLMAANGGLAPPSWVFAILDLPGGLLGLACVMSFGRFENNALALMFMIMAIMLAAVELALSTLAFRSGMLGGILWQVLLGAGVLVPHCLLCGSPVFDRLISASEASGATSTFLIFTSDLCGYAGACALLAWKVFACDDQSRANILSYYITTINLVAFGMLAVYAGAAYYFWRRLLAAPAARSGSGQASGALCLLPGGSGGVPGAQ